MRLALAQLNPTVGDLPGNSALVIDAARRAGRGRGRIAGRLGAGHQRLSAEGPAAADGLRRGVRRAVDELADSCRGDWACSSGIPRIAACPGRADRQRGQPAVRRPDRRDRPQDAAAELRRLRRAALLSSGDGSQPIEFRRTTAGRAHLRRRLVGRSPRRPITTGPTPVIDPVAELAQQGVDCSSTCRPVRSRSTSPTGGSRHSRAAHARRHGLPFLFVNQVGGNDDLVFDGHSLVIECDGDAVVKRLAGISIGLRGDRSRRVCLRRIPAATRTARVTAARCARPRPKGLHAPSAASPIACWACPAASTVRWRPTSRPRPSAPQHVHGLVMPSRYSSEHSVDDAHALAEALGIDWQIIPIDEVHGPTRSCRRSRTISRRSRAGLADQNLQARIRGAIVMIRSNRHGWMALATGNKSELAVGYCTLYGDMAAGSRCCAICSSTVRRVAVHQRSGGPRDHSGRHAQQGPAIGGDVFFFFFFFVMHVLVEHVLNVAGALIKINQRYQRGNDKYRRRR